MLQVIRAQDAMQFIFQIKVYWQLNCHIKYLPFRVKNYSKYGSPHKVYVPPHPSPPITVLSPCTCPPHMGGGTSPPPYHQGLGKTLHFPRRWHNFRPRKVFRQDLLPLKIPLIDTFLATKVTISHDNFIAIEQMKKFGARLNFSDFHEQKFGRQQEPGF